MGCYQEGVAKDSIMGKDVTAHIFECVPSHLTCYTNRASFVVQIHNQRHRYRPWRGVSGCLSRPDHLLFERTEQEEAEQVSDRWPTAEAVQTTEVFLGNSATVGSSTHLVLSSSPMVSDLSVSVYCLPLIFPLVCILLDVGTKPTGTSIYDLWKC